MKGTIMNSILNSISESAHQTSPNYFLAAGSIILFVTVAIMFMIALSIIFDVNDIHGWSDNFCVVMGVVLAICVILGMLLLLKGMFDVEITANNKQSLQEWRRFEKALSADSGYTFYYNGQAVSGAAIGIDKNDIGDYKIKYDPTNKTVIIRDR